MKLTPAGPHLEQIRCRRQPPSAIKYDILLGDAKADANADADADADADANADANADADASNGKVIAAAMLFKLLLTFFIPTVPQSLLIIC